MALVQNFNVSPYYDDYDEDKKFLRLLFRPGYAIQARELTQLQTILQKQVARFGSHTFKNGSVVTGGEMSISTTAVYHKLETTTAAGDDIDVNVFLGKKIGNITALSAGGSLGKVVAVSEATDTDPPTIFVEYKTARTLISGETFFTIDVDQHQARLVSTLSTSRSAIAYINEGIYYIDGFFVKVLPQTLILEKYTNLATYRVGLTYSESIVDETTDTSLLDPALNASNYQAPGSSRYLVDLTLDKRSYSSTDTSKFIEFIRMESGNITLKNNYPIYAELEKTLARRTYDESGNYTVRPFVIHMSDHVPANTTQSANTAKFTATLSAGKAYVRGFEIETVSPLNIELDRARDTESVQNYDIAANYGNYVNIANTKGLLDVSTMAVLDMHNVNTGAISTASSSAYNATKIGTVRVREIQYTSSANTQLTDTYKYRLYLNDTRFTTNNTIKDIESFAVINAAVKIVTSANVDNSSKEGAVTTGSVYFSDTDFKELLFRVPQSFVAFGMSDQDYRGRAVFKNQTVTTGSFSISTGIANNVFIGSGSLSDAQRLDHFYVVANSASGSSEFTNGQVIPMVSATGRNISVSGSTATLNLNSANSFTVDVIATVDFNTPTQKTKSLVIANTSVIGTSGTSIGNTTVYLSFGQVAISTPNKTPGSSDTLYISDVYKLEGKYEETYGYHNIIIGSTTKRSSFKVVDSGNTAAAVVVADLSNSAKDITTRYRLDDGQRDGHYDHGAIILLPGATPPTGQILVLVNYFTHTGSGYITVDSYNHATLGSTADIRYAKIPNYTSPTTGITFKLRDCIDFRPIRANASNTTPDFILSGISIPKAGESLESDYSYYLPRNDRLVLTEERKFQVIKGISSLTPQTPAELDNAMSLYTLHITPYTFFPSDVKVKFIENKRYTMRDIGKLEKRIENIEYYTTLNTLEKSAQDLTVLDGNGLTRFKNGILVDSFRGHQVGDVKNFDYNCSMNFEEGELRPSYYANSISFVANTALTTATIKANQIVLSPFTVIPAVSQNVATSGVAVNPFTLSNFSGTMSFYPPGDFWIDTETRPDVLVNLEGENDAWEQIGKGLEDSRAPGWSSQWGAWNSYVTGQSVDITTRTENRTEGYLDYRDTIQDTTHTTFYSAERSGTKNVLVPERIVKSIGKRQVDLSIVPYVRAQWIVAVARGLRPNQYHYLFAEEGNLDGTKYIEYPSYVRLYNVSGNFNDGYGIYEKITSSSGGSAILLKQTGRSWSLDQPFIYLGDVRGTFAANDTITGAVSGATAKIDVMFWNNGNVTTAAASTITLGSGSPYDNTYANIVSAYASVTWPSSGLQPRRAQKELTEWYFIRIIAGKGIGQKRLITNYNGTTKVATITPNWDVIPDSTSRWTVGKPQSNDNGDMPGRFYLPNYGPTAYDGGWRSKMGPNLFRLVNDPGNRTDFINSFAEEHWQAQGILNTVEDVSVSVRVPTSQSRAVYDKENNYTQTSVVSSMGLGTTLIADRTPPPQPPVVPLPPPVAPPAAPPAPAPGEPPPIPPLPTPLPIIIPMPEPEVVIPFLPSPIDGGGYITESPPPPPQPAVEQPAACNSNPQTIEGFADSVAMAGEGGDAGPGTIICTKLHELGYLPKEIYEADEAFGRILREKDPNAYYGYVKWATIVVDWMSGKGPQCMFWIRNPEKRAEVQRKLAISWAIKIATPWAEHMAYVMGIGEQDNPTGKKLMKFGLFISRIIGKLTDRKINFVSNKNRLGVGYLLWLIFGGLRLITLMNRK